MGAKAQYSGKAGMKHTTLRVAEPRDLPALYARLAEQNERDGTCYPIPEIFDAKGKQSKFVPLALIVEHHGKVHGGIIFESAGRGVEMMLVGCGPRVTAMAQSERKGIEYTLRNLGFSWIRCLVTKSVVKYLKAPMKDAGFTRTDTRFASFFKELQ
jgi:hypothetical protein